MFEEFVNRQIGDFMVQDPIGRGAMSTVYRAFQKSVNRVVAVKVIDFSINPFAAQNFLDPFSDEVKVIAALEHIHILPVYNYGVVNGATTYIVMRLLRGGSVSDLLPDAPLSLDKALNIFLQVAQGLAYAHSREVMHRDLKPTNILLDDLGNAYLTDFGLGRLAEVALDVTDTGSAISTPLYASPEQLNGDEIDYRSDIYSLSAIMYHMLTGHAPFEMGEGGFAEFLQRHNQHQPIAPREYNPAIPEDVAAIIMQGLKRDPEERPISIAHMAEALERSTGRKASILDTITYSAVDPGLPRRKRWLLPLIAGALVLALIAAAAFVSQHNSPSARHPATVLAGTRGTVEDALPTADEIAAASARLGGKGVIAFISCNMGNQFQAEQARVMADTALRYGLPFRVYDSGMDEYTQITQVERARLDGAAALILCTLDSSALDTSLESIQKAHIPIVFLSPYPRTFGGVVLDGDNHELGLREGRAAGQIVRDEMDGQADVIILNFPDTLVSRDRSAGMEMGLHEFAPQANIIGTYQGGTRDNAEASVKALIEQGVHFDVIMSINDDGGLGAIQALDDAGFAPDSVVVTGINGAPEALEAIRAGHFFRATVLFDPSASSEMALNAAVKMLAGGTLPELLTFPPGDVVTRESLMAQEQAAA
jgi:ABC-type sugar transport system substrate-binding protein